MEIRGLIRAGVSGPEIALQSSGKWKQLLPCQLSVFILEAYRGVLSRAQRVKVLGQEYEVATNVRFNNPTRTMVVSTPLMDIHLVRYEKTFGGAPNPSDRVSVRLVLPTIDTSSDGEDNSQFSFGGGEEENQ